MPPSEINYESAVELPRMTRCQIVGRTIAISSLLLPFGTFFAMGAVPESFRMNHLGVLIPIWTGLLALAVCLGVVGLIGVRWWGERGVWVPATLGICFSVSYYVLAMYSVG